MSLYERFARRCEWVSQFQSGCAIDATRLWNWADHQADPEIFWAILRQWIPDMFFGPSYNDFYFTYGKKFAERGAI